MATVVVGEYLRIPGWVADLPSFRQWACSPEFPERGRVAYLDGDIWVDPIMERSVHNRIKTKIGAILALLADMQGLGLYYGDGMLLTNLEADLSTMPDGMFISAASLESGSACLEEGDDALEVVGTADMVLEVVSPTSVAKDTVILPRQYWKAGVPEFWLVDSRDAEPQLVIHRRGRSKYTAVRPVDGWVKSAVFGKSFRLVRRASVQGVSEFALESK